MTKLRVALIGAGQIARVSHIANYQSIPGVKVVGICDTNLENAKAAAAEFSIPQYFDNHIDMLKAVQPDAVSICVPNAFHAAITCDALNLGCHVYCEKPPAITLPEAIEMEKTALAKDRLLTFGFHFRHGENVSYLKQQAKNGKFGSIYGATAQWIRRRGIPGWGNFTNKKLQGGGPLIDLGAHMLDLVFYLLDYPMLDYVCATTSDLIGKRGGTGLMGTWSGEAFSVEDSLSGFIKLRNGASIQLNTAYAMNIKERDIRSVMVYGAEMGASLFPLETYGEENGMLLNQDFPHLQQTDLHQAAIYNFVGACLGEAELLVTAKQAVYLQKVICACYQAAETGKPIMFTEG